MSEQAFLVIKKSCDRCGLEYKSESVYDPSKMKDLTKAIQKPILKIFYEDVEDELLNLCTKCTPVVKKAVHRILFKNADKRG